ncbi:type VII secretion target [Tomitella cavernea]|uniref:type VII secretion target n=1 Tax=Tomitella cavernea TaxID=1387982 RepID=UPI0027DB13ED|nr:type VII secretion target [Tomitella cavernea]
MNLIASVDHIRWCADEFAGAGDGVGAASDADTAGVAAALGPVFGVLGGGFVESFAAAHAAHAAGAAGLGAVLGAAGATATAIADAYEKHESAQASALAAEGGL